MQHIFNHDFILGQISIVAPLVVVIIYLKVAKRTPPVSQPTHIKPESTEWLNALLHQVADAYRSKLRDVQGDVEGVEVLRRRVEHFVNLARPSDVMDPIQVHSVNLGVAAPQISNASSRHVLGLESLECSEFEMVYKDDISISLSTVYHIKYPIFFNPTPLPISITVGLSVFSCRVVITPPPLSSPAPAFTLSVPNFTLDLKSTWKPQTFLGSPNLTNVPVLHARIENELRDVLRQWRTLEVVLPGFGLF